MNAEQNSWPPPPSNARRQLSALQPGPYCGPAVTVAVECRRVEFDDDCVPLADVKGSSVAKELLKRLDKLLERLDDRLKETLDDMLLEALAERLLATLLEMLPEKLVKQLPVV